MPRHLLHLLFGLLCSVLLLVALPARADIPDETYEALGLTKEASPKELYDALVKRYHDPKQGHGKGAFGDLWEPTPFTRYLDPKTLYVAPDMDFEASRDECVECHASVTPGWVHSWQKSVHGDLDEIRNLPEDDSRAYKKELIDQVEANLHSMGVLPDGQKLGDVGCIDCHMGVGKQTGNHKADLHMPDAANCGQCHVQQFAERESERDTITWPQEQWPAGRPSHALSWQANVETAIWAGMAQREVADGCSLCHTMQNTCNSCHTRHEFSAAEARKPETCSTCHSSREDRRIMAVAPFEQTCSSCHLDQIVGKERATGPKGIAFLTLPGLDLETLKKNNATVGEWPDASEAELTPFMKVMISRNEPGHALIKTVDSLNLQDLADASADQIKAVTDLVWEIKGLFHALIAGKASDVLGDLNIVSGARLSANLVADLTASLPRDVVASAHQQWLPNLGREMADRLAGSATGQTGDLPFPAEKQRRAMEADAEEAKPDGDEETLSAENASSALTEAGLDGSESPEELSGSSLSPEAAGGEPASKARVDPQACIVSVLGQCLMFKGTGATGQPDTTSSAQDLPLPMQAGLKEIAQAARPEGAAGKTDTANAQPRSKAPERTDDLLFPTEEELRAAGIKGREKADRPDGAAETDAATDDAPAGSDTAAAEPQTSAAPVITIESDVDPESWAEYGGWYRQDYAIFYRPTGHKDKFIYSWLFLTGPQAPKGDTSPAAAVFDSLTGKDAQGSCTKCHSVDDIPGKGRVVNFSPPSVESKQGRFTNFIHEPHFGMMDDRGCLTCHSLEKERTYLKSYEQGNPQSFVSNFGAVEKDLCQSCHTRSMARQDCLLCHTYHVNGVITPIMNTRVPTE